MIKTNFLVGKKPKGNMHYACINTDSVMRMETKNYPQIYLKECKYKIKKIEI